MPDTASHEPIHLEADFDFRSQRFADDATALARITGRSLEHCRQELFIAEGDVALALAVIEQGYEALMRHHALH